MEYNNMFYGDAYCVKCKEKRDFEGWIKTSDSGRRMAYGNCPECGTKVNRILGASPNAPAPKIVPPAVPMPQAKTFGTIEVFLREDGKWQATATDTRRSYNNTARFVSRSKNRVLRDANRWIDSWKKLTKSEVIINGNV
jgi:hypothetical protein